jgi:spermidine synthase
MNFLQTLVSDIGLTATELGLALLACALAISMGATLAKRQARAYKQHADENMQHHGHLPLVTFSDYGDMRFLHFGTPAVQGSMRISKPYEIHLDYVQRMMAWLLFVDLDRISNLSAMQLGLGAASLTKFCHHHLNMRTTAIELNPQVITICRRWFHLTENTANLKVIEADAGQFVSQHAEHEKIDVLQVDLYDQDAAQPVIDSEDFYRDCKRMLNSSGFMTVNIFGHASCYDESLRRITAAFGSESVWAFKPTLAGNLIVLAFAHPRSFNQSALIAQANAIQTRWQLPATKWLKELAPLQMAK